jgi:serine phosphatase RsbU (regulator of sigma subunit)/pSer/pThr/pTyr-binding forkhead associated (FHA) protein
MASLTVLKGTNPGDRINLDGDLFVMGRNPDCQIHIHNNAVSRQHAKIVRQHNVFFIEDMESRNGTWVNNQEIKQRTPLKDNDRIKICDCLFTFHHDSAKDSKVEIDDSPDSEHSSTVQASVGRMSQQQLLESQPSDRLRAILEVSAALSKTLQEETLLPMIADTLFNVFKQADRCFVIIREVNEGHEKLIPKVIKTRRANTETTARFSKTIVNRVLQSGQSLLYEDTQNGGKVALSASIAEFKIRSVMCAPLLDPDGNAYGLIQLDSQDRLKTFTQDDLNLLVGVANQAAIALENARLHKVAVEMAVKQKDEQLAKDVQRSFLPATLPELPGYQFYAFYQAAKNVGGDYYDFFAHPGEQTAVVLGDVAGKGMPAALLMAKLSAEARYCLLTNANIAKAVGKLNEQLLQAGMMDRFVTLSASLVNPQSHTVTIASAGHESPLIYRRASHAIEIGIPHGLSGFPLGMIEGTEYESNTIELSRGDCVIVFTDGVTDALSLDNVPFGMERVHQAILGDANLPPEDYTPQAIGKRLIAAVHKFTSGQYQNDDIALVCYGRLENPLPESSSETGRVVTGTGPMTQTIKKRPRPIDD